MQEGGGSQYGVPPLDMTAFLAPGGTGGRAHALETQQQQQRPPAEPASPSSGRHITPTSSFDELAPPVSSGGFPEEDALAAGAGEETDRGGATSNRWPLEETLALLRIRSEMDATFRDATPKGPLWEHVSRKLAELGYKRSTKKCREKFENVQKYYKRTKDSRGGRQDGKSYRFFTQLEALHSGRGDCGAVPTPAPPTSAHPNPPSSSTAGVGSSGSLQPTPLNAIPLSLVTSPHVVPVRIATGTTAGGSVSYPTGGISFCSNSSSSASESEEEGTEAAALRGESRKRKGRWGGRGGDRKMMSFFEGLMKQVMQRQEAMQEKFLEAIEKREQDRMIREEAWRRQEMARLTRENELMGQERAISASRDAAIIAFLEKTSGQTVPPAPSDPPTAVPQPLSQQKSPPPVSPPVSAPSPAPHRRQQPLGQQHLHHEATQVTPLQIVPLVASTEAPDAAACGISTDPASSRWPQLEVHALIKLRSEMELRYQEASPKGPLWEEIAAGMRRMGYNRPPKRCKEKWENINKYFKKVKDSNKKRPDDARTCPYFHQLDALYRKKFPGSGAMREEENSSSMSPAPNPQVDVAAAPPPQLALSPQLPHKDVEGKNININGGGTNNNGNRSSSNPERDGTQKIQMETHGNGGLTPSFLYQAGGAGSDGALKKPGDTVNELMDQQPRQQGAAAVDDYDKLEETDSDRMVEVDDDDDDDDEDDDEEDDEKGKMAYQIEYQQRPGVKGADSSGGGNQSAAGAATAPAGSFMAMVQ